jgi:hypothetical protein
MIRNLTYLWIVLAVLEMLAFPTYAQQLTLSGEAFSTFHRISW